jgi:hypothetical protein
LNKVVLLSFPQNSVNTDQVSEGKNFRRNGLRYVFSYKSKTIGQAKSFISKAEFLGKPLFFFF